jgi:hypothetical protein
MLEKHLPGAIHDLLALGGMLDLSFGARRKGRHDSSKPTLL